MTRSLPRQIQTTITYLEMRALPQREIIIPSADVKLERALRPAVSFYRYVYSTIGKGLGTILLNAMIDQAWRHRPQRLWLHTCTLDHPKALAVYQRAGFVSYKQETKVFPDPRDLGVM